MTYTKESNNFTISIVKGDIIKAETDAIVNAANQSLLGGGGVDGAIHYAAGPELLAECKTLNGCETGEAKITNGYKIPAKHVIHTVGPIYSSAKGDASTLLQNCYTKCLKLADKYALKSIAFPSISTGSFGFPIEKATEIALKTTIDFLDKHQTSIKQVFFIAYSDHDLEVYKNTFALLTK
jgi:O-acetyl-ADP-ribose deacetylase